MNTSPESVMTGALISILIFIAMFLLCREVIAWYWKINTRVALQREALNTLNEISQKISILTAIATAKGTSRSCPTCGKKILAEDPSVYCADCGGQLLITK